MLCHAHLCLLMRYGLGIFPEGLRACVLALTEMLMSVRRRCTARSAARGTRWAWKRGGLPGSGQVCPHIAAIVIRCSLTALYIGSTLHALKSLAHPRWEDYNYEAVDPVQNRFYWLGDGQTHNEKTLTGDSTSHLIFTAHNELGSDDLVRVIGAWYLREPFLDIPPSEC